MRAENVIFSVKAGILQVLGPHFFPQLDCPGLTGLKRFVTKSLEVLQSGGCLVFPVVTNGAANFSGWTEKGTACQIEARGSLNLAEMGTEVAKQCQNLTMFRYLQIQPEFRSLWKGQSHRNSVC